MAVSFSYEAVYSEASTSMAESVTRHAQNTELQESRFLLCGIDSLDLGLYVTWGSNWEDRLRFLDSKKREAQKEDGGLLLEMPSGRRFSFKPGGKGDNYRFHLEFPDTISSSARGQLPAKAPMSLFLSMLKQSGSSKSKPLLTT